MVRSLLLVLAAINILYSDCGICLTATKHIPRHHIRQSIFSITMNTCSRVVSTRRQVRYFGGCYNPVWSSLVFDTSHAREILVNFYVNIMFEGAAQFSKPIDVAPKWREKFEDRGFVDMQEKVLKVCILP